MRPKAQDIDPLVLNVPATYRTERLGFHKPSAWMAQALAEARAESYASLWPWFHEDMGAEAEETAADWQAQRLATQAADFDHRRDLTYYVFEGGRLLGMVGLRPIWRRGQGKLTYWLRSSAQRRGYGTEAVAASIIFAAKALDARLITTGHAESNVASARLAKALGFQKIARQPLGCEMPDGTLVAGIGYALEAFDRPEWPVVTWE